MNVYGYCRVSTPNQNIERQVRNIHDYNPDAFIIRETYTGRKIEGRRQFQKLLKRLEPGDMVIFDDVSRMSRNAEEGYALYEKLYNDGINLVFLNQHLIDTATYKQAIDNQIALTGSLVDSILVGVNEYLLQLAKIQIQLAFKQAQHEIDDLHRRTREGMQTARLNGKQIGRKQGAEIKTKIGEQTKKAIKAHNKDFGGTLNDTETMKIAGCARATFYRYKHQLEAEEAEAEAEE